MANLTSRWTLLLPLAALAGGALLLGGRQVRPSSAAPPTLPSPATTPAPVAAVVSPEHEARVPLAFSLRSREGATARELLVTVAIDVHRPITYPVDLRLSLPPGARLLEGPPAEQLDLRTAGPHEREFRLQLDEPLSLRAPLKVTLHGSDTVSGLHGEKQLPAAPELTVPRRQGPVPPGGRPGRGGLAVQPLWARGSARLQRSRRRAPRAWARPDRQGWAARKTRSVSGRGRSGLRWP